MTRRVVLLALISAGPLLAETLIAPTNADWKADAPGPDNLGVADAVKWSVRKRTLRGGPRDGIDLIDVDNGALKFSMGNLSTSILLVLLGHLEFGVFLEVTVLAGDGNRLGVVGDALGNDLLVFHPLFLVALAGDEEYRRSRLDMGKPCAGLSGSLRQSETTDSGRLPHRRTG